MLAGRGKVPEGGVNKRNYCGLMQRVVQVCRICGLKEVGDEAGRDNFRSEGGEEEQQVLQVVQNVVGLIFMDVSGVGFDQQLKDISFIDILQVEAHLVLLASKANQQVKKGGFVFDPAEVE